MMGGFTGLVDTLLAQRLAPRVVDALRLPAAVPGPTPAAAVAAVADDALLPRMPAGQAGMPPAAPAARALSAAGVAIAELLAALPAPAGPVRGAAPLASGPEGGPAALARSLALAVARSGLFYESHLAQAAGGALDVAPLRQEPQAAWSRRDGANDDRDAAGATVRPPRDDGSPAAGRAAEVVHPQARALVAQQLEVLATGIFRWSGEAWPGVPLQWTVQEDRTADTADGDTGEPAGRWSTALALCLPQLGAVEVRLVLAGSKLRVRVCAAEPATQHLRAASRELPERLAAAGLALPELAIVAAEAP